MDHEKYLETRHKLNRAIMVTGVSTTASGPSLLHAKKRPDKSSTGCKARAQRKERRDAEDSTKRRPSLPGRVSPAPLRAAQGADAADREIHGGGGGRLARTGGKAAVPQQYASESTAATVSKHEGGLRVVL